MSTLTINSLSSQAAVALPALLAIIGLIYSPARPLIVVGVAAALLMLFKPLVFGVIRAALLSLTTTQKRFDVARSAYALNRLANEVAETQPNLASELRLLAASR